MTIKRILWVAAALVCVALGFVTAQQIDRVRYQDRTAAAETLYQQRTTEVRAAAEQWVDAVTRTQGEVVLRAFAAGISPAVLAGRREGIEIAAVSLLHAPGIAGIHVLGLDGAVLYSSDAKVVATGDAAYRGGWALQVAELTTRPSTRPGVVDIAMPIVNSGTPLAVAWLEYDVGAIKSAARPADLNGTAQSDADAVETTPAQ